MKRNLQMLAGPVLITAGLFIGCYSPRVVERTDPSRPSTVQVAEGFDTVGRKWEQPAPPPAPAPVVATATTPFVWPAAGAPAPASTPVHVHEPEVITRNDSMVLNYTGTITEIDYPNREITLKDSEGDTESFIVDKDVSRFSEAKVGDKISMDYSLGVTSEVRKPTPEEAEKPLEVLESQSIAGPDSDPSARSTRKVRAVVTIDAMDRTAQTITVKGPRGKRFVARVKDPSRFQQVHIGDTVLMTFTEATAVSLKPANEQ